MKNLNKFNAHFSYTVLNPALSSADMTVVMDNLERVIQKEFVKRLENVRSSQLATTIL